jgi:hypothetical protein
VVEAMISHRPYRPALPIEEALAEVESGAGVRYDADVCAACIRLFREKGFTLSSWLAIASAPGSRHAASTGLVASTKCRRGS